MTICWRFSEGRWLLNYNLDLGIDAIDGKFPLEFQCDRIGDVAQSVISKLNLDVAFHPVEFCTLCVYWNDDRTVDGFKHLLVNQSGDQTSSCTTVDTATT